MQASVYVCAAGMEEESPPFFEEDESLLIIKSLLHAAGKHACHIRPHTSAYVTYLRIRQHTDVTYLRIRQHTEARACGRMRRMLPDADVC